MSKYSLAHLSEGALLSGTKANRSQERGALALGLAQIAEIETRESYKPAGYSSMHMYCVHELHLSKDAAKKRIRAARKAREFPVVFEKVEQGALRLTSLLILASFLTTENAEELLAAASFRSDFEVREILAERFPQAPVPTTIEPIAEPMALEPIAAPPELDQRTESVSEHAEGAAQPLQGIVKPLHIKPIAAGLYKATLTMSRAMHDKLRRAKDLLGYRKSAPDEAEILEAGLDLFIARLEKQKFGATDNPRAARQSKSPHYISHDVKRQVWARDGGRCAFASENGTRCPETKGLEYEHIVPYAKGGNSGEGNICLHCRAHNQLQAERAYGKQFMQNKREQAKAAAATRRAEKEAREAAEKEALKATQRAKDDVELIAWLQRFGYSAEAAKSVADVKRTVIYPETRRLMCLAALRENETRTWTGTSRMSTDSGLVSPPSA